MKHGVTSYRGQDALTDWRLLQGCTLPGPLPCYLAMIALHPQYGIALLDMAPAETPEAAQRLLSRLERAGFAVIYGGICPPVRHLIMREADFARLPTMLRDAFRNCPEPVLPGDDAWVETAARVLQREAPRAETPQPNLTERLPEPPPAPRRWRGPVLALSLLPVMLGAWAFWPAGTPRAPAAPPAPLAAAPPPALAAVPPVPPPVAAATRPDPILPPPAASVTPVAVRATPPAPPTPPPVANRSSQPTPAERRGAAVPPQAAPAHASAGKPNPVRAGRHCDRAARQGHRAKAACR